MTTRHVGVYQAPPYDWRSKQQATVLVDVWSLESDQEYKRGE